jgi:hypothetical protein
MVVAVLDADPPWRPSHRQSVNREWAVVLLFVVAVLNQGPPVFRLARRRGFRSPFLGAKLAFALNLSSSSNIQYTCIVEARQTG